MSAARALLLGLAPLVVSFGLFTPACSRQYEGERCELANGNEDCEGTELVCTPGKNLRGNVSRCCPEEGAAISDDRCDPLDDLTGGSAGSGGTAGSGGSGGSGAGGSAGTSGSGGGGQAGAEG